jgi:hypothetical protein
MTFRRLFTLAALAGSLILAANTAQAGYTFVSIPTPATTVFGGSTLSLIATSSAGTMSGASFINIADVALSSTTVPPATDTTVINVSIGVQITNVPPPGTAASGVISGTGTLTITRSDTGGELSFITFGAVNNNGANIGGVTYTLSNLSYTPPTVNSGAGDGNISVLVTPNFIPEPGSMVMLGSGLVGVVGFGLRRMKKA